MTGKQRKMAFITSCLDDWGGSEDLWARSIPLFMKKGIKSVTVFKNRINRAHPEFADLAKLNVRLEEFSPVVRFPKKMALKLADIAARIGDKIGIAEYQWNKPVSSLHKKLKRLNPDIVIISQGINFDGLAFAYQCFKLNIPYVVVCHKAVNFYWPQQGDREYMRLTLLNAKKCFFVSEHNKLLTEEQFGVRLPNSAIVANPIKTPVNPLPFPATGQGYRLACIGRLFIIDKGQDMLLRVLALPKWRERAVHVSFFGKGPDRAGLIEMAKVLKVDHVSFPGYSDSLEQLWSTHHALILPSRSEGLPLTIIEAMSLGRMVIATNAGGNGEIIEDKVTGFIGEVNERDLDIAMEKAWEMRQEWDILGRNAAKRMAEILPANPLDTFTDTVISMLP